MYTDGKIYMGITDTEDRQRVYMNLNQCNRHGLITGASGTGKTITMKVMAESFSAAGVPVFMCDVKGDVSGMCVPGADNEGMQKRIDKFGIRDTFTYQKYPVMFWDIYGMGGHPIRATVSDIGPSILAQMMELTEVQEGVLHTIFRIADDKGLKILDLKDLRAVINFVSERTKEYTVKYGNIATASLGAITRALIPLENQGGTAFFGEPMLDIHDWMKTDADGRGYINILHSVEMIRHPKLYSMFLLWMMAELFEELPEVGDPDKPKIVFFFDEAHLLFNDAPRALLSTVEQTVKLIRSKGVGIYFVSQSPSDIPNTVLAQLSNRVQHALRAYTPVEQKAVKTAAQTFRPNPAFNTEDEIMNLGTGHALTSFLDEEGTPQIVQKTSIICPESYMGEADPGSKAEALNTSPVKGKYDQAVDSESAYEILNEINAELNEAEGTAGQTETVPAEPERPKTKTELLQEELARKKAQQSQTLTPEQKAEAKKKEAEEKKKAKEEEKKRKAEEKKKQKRRDRIESQLISTGGAVLKRGILGILKKL